MDRMKDTGDIDGFAVVTQRPELGPVNQPDTGVSIAINASDKQLVVWAAVLAQAVARRGHHSPRRIAQDLYNVITSWKTYEEGYTQEDWEGERDDRVH